MTKEELKVQKLEKIFNKHYEVLKKIAIRELEMILETPKTVSIPAKNLALEITKSN